MKGPLAATVYGGKIIKDLHLEDDYTLYVVGSVQKKTVTASAGNTLSTKTK